MAERSETALPTPLPVWLRSQAVRKDDMGPAETEWCDRMHEAADEIEMLRARLTPPPPHWAIDWPAEGDEAESVKLPIQTCSKCGAQAVAFNCSTRGCPVNGGAAYG